MSVDVLMVTPNRPAYTKVSLEHLLESWDDYTTTVVQWIGRLRMSACAIQEGPAYPRLSSPKVWMAPIMPGVASRWSRTAR